MPSAEMVPEYPSPSHTQQQAYQQHYGVPQYPGPPPQYDRKGSSGGGLPNVLWVLIGVVIATVVSKVYGVVSSPGGIQGWMMQQAMKAAMKGMGQPGQPGQAPNPFGAGGMPAGFPGMPPNMGAQMGQGWPPAVDTTARPVGQQQSQPAASSPQPPFNQNVNAGKRFQEHKAQQAKKPPSAASQRNTASSAPAASTPPPSSFVDPPKKAASFTDVGDDDGTSSSYAASGTGPVSAQGSFADNQFAGAGFGQQQQQQASSSGSSGEGGKNKMVDMMERMLKDPNMQKMLYPHLPEGMRNPATIEWMMSNPEYRAQLEATLSNQGAFDPKTMEALQMDTNWEEQLKAINMTPEVVIEKIMSDPELAEAFSKPEVQTAMMECTQNPMNVVKYQSNPEIMNVFKKIEMLFPQNSGGMPGGPPGGMPGGMPGQ